MSSNKIIRDVAKVARDIMIGEALKGDQHKIDKNKNGKIDAQDFEMLRKEKGVKQEASCDKMKKEETELTESNFKVGDEVKCKASGMEGKVVKVDPKEEGKYYTVKREDGKEMKYAPDELKLDEEALDEATPTRQQVKQAIGIARDKRYAGGNMTGAMKAMNKINKGLGQHPAVAAELKKQNEEVEQLDEYTPDKSGVTKIQGRAYGASKPEKHAVDTMKGPTRKELSAIEKEKKKPFKEMLELYAEKGLKALSEMTMTEEPDQEQYEKELEQAKKKATQKKTPEEEAGVAKAAVQSVKIEEENHVNPDMTGHENKNTNSHTSENHEAEKKHGAILIHKYHEGPSHIKNHTVHGYNIYHKKPGKKAKLIGDTEVHVHNKTGSHYYSESRTHDSEISHDNDSHHDYAISRVAHEAGVHEDAPWKHAKEDPRKMKKEEVEQLDELSPKTLGSYIKKASQNASDHSFDHGDDEYRQYPGDDPDADKEVENRERKIEKRQKGVNTATNKLVKKATNEEVEQINERPMTDAEMEKREDIVKGMKKNLKGFKERYGKRAKNVMYATATKQAMKDED